MPFLGTNMLEIQPWRQPVTSRSALVRGSSILLEKYRASIHISTVTLFTGPLLKHLVARERYWLSHPVHLVIEHLHQSGCPCIHSYRSTYISPIFQSCQFHAPDQLTKLFAPYPEAYIYIHIAGHISSHTNLTTKYPSHSSVNWEDSPHSVLEDQY